MGGEAKVCDRSFTDRRGRTIFMAANSHNFFRQTVLMGRAEISQLLRMRRAQTKLLISRKAFPAVTVGQLTCAQRVDVEDFIHRYDRIDAWEGEGGAIGSPKPVQRALPATEQVTPPTDKPTLHEKEN